MFHKAVNIEGGARSCILSWLCSNVPSYSAIATEWSTSPNDSKLYSKDIFVRLQIFWYLLRQKNPPKKTNKTHFWADQGKVFFSPCRETCSHTRGHTPTILFMSSFFDILYKPKEKNSAPVSRLFFVLLSLLDIFGTHLSLSLKQSFSQCKQGKVIRTGAKGRLSMRASSAWVQFSLCA